MVAWTEILVSDQTLIFCSTFSALVISNGFAASSAASFVASSVAGSEQVAGKVPGPEGLASVL